jgi:hypothetical protein
MTAHFLLVEDCSTYVPFDRQEQKVTEMAFLAMETGDSEKPGFFSALFRNSGAFGPRLKQGKS